MKVEKKFFMCTLIITLIILLTSHVNADDDYEQEEEKFYEPLQDACDKCKCSNGTSTYVSGVEVKEEEEEEEQEKRVIFSIDCSRKNIQHLFNKWPEEIEESSENEIIYILSYNDVMRLQQFPPTNALLFFTCRHCQISSLTSKAFIDSPNVIMLDLAFNKISSEALHPDIFKGPFSDDEYSPIKLQTLDLSHNQLNYFDELLFEHTPHLLKLDLSYNAFNTLDEGTNAAIGRLLKLEVLDLSHTNIMDLSSELLTNLKHLRELNLNGNNFLNVPESLSLISKSLNHLHLSDNPIEVIRHDSFVNLIKLDQLNVSAMPHLSVIENEAFEPLISLEILECRGNKKLNVIDVQSLANKVHLKVLDISNNNLTTLMIEIDNRTRVEKFKHLHVLKLEENPWNCDCNLMKALEIFDRNSSAFKKAQLNDEARCLTPYNLASTIIYNFTSNYNCIDNSKNKPLKALSYDPPPFLRPRSIMLTIISIIVVVVAGVIIGCVIVCIKRRLKSQNDFGTSTNPIRYTAVRDSTISNRATIS